MKSGRLVLKKTGPNTTQTTAAKAAAVWLPVMAKFRTGHFGFYNREARESASLRSYGMFMKENWRLLFRLI